MALSYPLELLDNPDYYRAMIEIKAYKTEPAQISKVAAIESIRAAESGQSNDILGSLFGFASKGVDALGEALNSEASKDTLTGKGGQRLQEYRDKPITGREKIALDPAIQPIQLYMPVSFQMTDTLSYNTPDLGAGGAAALGVARQGGGLGEAAGAAVAQATAGISDTVGALLGNGGLGQLALARLGKMAGGPTQAAAELAGQAVMNPNIRATFRSVGPRRFTFLFQFIPKSPAEAATVESIIYNIRKAAYPKEVPENEAVPLLFEYPDLFRITQKVKTANGYEVLVGSPIKYCYLESIVVNINPIGNNTFHADGYPIQTDMSLTFLEYRTIHKADIVPGYGQVPADVEQPEVDDDATDFPENEGIVVEHIPNGPNRISDLQRQVNAIGVGDL